MAYTTIDDPSAHFQVKTYSGNSTQTAITFDGSSNLQPDWIWAKQRGGSHYHDWRDTSRGLTKRLVSATTDAEGTKSASYVSFDSNGFTLGDDQSGGSDANTVNSNGNNYVSWCWKANGGTTSSNSDGNITSTVQANTTAGFSIITYTGNFTDNQTIGHGLSQAPEALIIKNRDTGSTSWVIYHEGLNFPTKDLIYFNSNAANDHDPTFNNTAPSSSVITMGAYSFNNRSGDSHVCYAFHSVKGYSKFGSYQGNGNEDGAFIYTGFKPKWVMIKCTTSASTSWNIFDTTREDDGGSEDGNVMTEFLQADSNGAENTSGSNISDFLSNGFKCRGTSSATNGSGQTYIYFAFAEHPFVSSKGVPTTAR